MDFVQDPLFPTSAIQTTGLAQPEPRNEDTETVDEQAEAA